MIKPVGSAAVRTERHSQRLVAFSEIIIVRSQHKSGGACAGALENHRRCQRVGPRKGDARVKTFAAFFRKALKVICGDAGSGQHQRYVNALARHQLTAQGHRKLGVLLCARAAFGYGPGIAALKTHHRGVIVVNYDFGLLPGRDTRGKRSARFQKHRLSRLVIAVISYFKRRRAALGVAGNAD